MNNIYALQKCVFVFCVLIFCSKTFLKVKENIYVNDR